MLSWRPVKQSKPDNNPREESRNRIRVLAKNTETLYRECRSDQEKAMNVRAMGSTLAALSVLVNRLGQESGNTHAPDILKDAQVVTCQAVRFCDLDRFSDK